MPELTICPQCEQTMPAGAPQGLCPRCLLSGVVHDTSVPTADSKGTAPTVHWHAGRQPPAVDELDALFPQLDVLELIGTGGMGAVYKARQKSLDRIVALKILPPEAAVDPAFAERFHREARTLARLNHPHIVGVYDCGQQGELYYLLMEYVDGVNLRQAFQAWEQESRAGAEAGGLAIISQACEALQYAHKEGIIHRDIKPENILIDRQGQVKVADFGLAKMLQRAPEDFTLTGTRQVMGTPHYMAPEQIEAPQQVDHRADLYSLGVVFYEILTGHLPMGRFAAPSSRCGCDARLDEIVHRALEREPETRYQRASELKQALDQYLFGNLARADSIPPHTVPVADPVSSPPTKSPAHQQSMLEASPGHEFPVGAAVAGLVVIFVALLTVVVYAGGMVWAVVVPMVALPLILLASVVFAKQRGASRLHDPHAALGVGEYDASRIRERVDKLGKTFRILGAVNMFVPVAVLAVVTYIASAGPLPELEWARLLSIPTAITGILLLAAGIGAKRLVMYPLIMLAAVVACLPMSYFWPVNLVVGIWAVNLLLATDTELLFAQARRVTASPKGKPSRGGDRRASEGVGCAVTAFVLVVVLAMAFGALVLGYMSLRVTPPPAVSGGDEASTTQQATASAIFRYAIDAGTEFQAKQAYPEIQRIVYARLQAARFPLTIYEPKNLNPRFIQFTSPVRTREQLERGKFLTGTQGKLAFGLVALPEQKDELLDDQGNATEQARWVRVRDAKEQQITGENAITRRDSANELEVLVVVEDEEQGLPIDRRALQSISVDRAGNSPSLRLDFTSAGSAKIEMLTRWNLPSQGQPRQLAVLLDDQLLSAPRIMAPIIGKAVLTGDFEQSFLEDLVIILSHDELPLRLIPQ